VTAGREETFAGLERRIGHVFRDRALLQEALTHKSALAERAAQKSNERLEFLGDRVLGLIVARRLFESFPETGENNLAPRLNALVNRVACARAARRVDLGAVMIIAASEESDGGRDKEAILGNACEALIAALYLDGGLSAAEAFVARAWADEFERADSVRKDAKTALQEWAAAQKRNLSYELIERSGPEHAPRFVVETRIDRAAPARGEGGSKRAAEQAAAAAFIHAAGIDG
jgi:ribonuclease-3